MADNFGLKIGLEGEKEFKKVLAEINSQFKVLGSEIKFVESQFGKNFTSVEELTAKNGVFIKEIEEQPQKIKVLEQALQNVGDPYNKLFSRINRDIDTKCIGITVYFFYKPCRFLPAFSPDKRVFRVYVLTV